MRNGSSEFLKLVVPSTRPGNFQVSLNAFIEEFNIHELKSPNDGSNNFGAIDVKTDGSVLEVKSSLKMLGLSFSSRWDQGSYIVSTRKTALEKI